MFKDESHNGSLSSGNATFSLCCANGQIKLPPIKEPPEKLKSLLIGNNKKERDFQTNLRAYNSSLAFVSISLTGKEYTFKTNGPYCYRIHGQVYHLLSQMQPELGRKPAFSQIYIYDQELENHLHTFKNLDRTVLKELQDMIKEVNPYAQQYKQAGDIMRENPTQDVNLILRSCNEDTNIDPRRYNLPTGTDVAVILPVDRQTVSERDVVVYKNASNHPEQKKLFNIKATHPMYDSLMYVLIFPFGDKGWERGYKSGNKEYTAMQYYKYRLMVHSGDTFNIIHHMGRLFQQYVVDMYVKIEDGRLGFIQRNQSKLRADLYQGLADALQHSDGMVDGSHIGKRVILPSSFTGSARYQHQLYQDAMATV